MQPHLAVFPKLPASPTPFHHQGWEQPPSSSILPSVPNPIIFVHRIVRLWRFTFRTGQPDRFSCCVIIVSGPLPLVHSCHRQGQVFVHTPSRHSSSSLMQYITVVLQEIAFTGFFLLSYFSQVWQVQLQITFMWADIFLFMCKMKVHGLGEFLPGGNNRRHATHWVTGITTNVKATRTITCLLISEIY